MAGGIHWCLLGYGGALLRFSEVHTVSLCKSSYAVGNVSSVKQITLGKFFLAFLSSGPGMAGKIAAADFRMTFLSEKCAVLLGAAWIRTASEIEGAVTPSLEVKSFPLSARPAAENGLEDRYEQKDSADDENFPV